MESILVGGALTLYLAASVAFLGFVPSRDERWGSAGAALLFAAAVTQAAALGLRSAELGWLAVTGARDGLALLAWGVAVVYLVLHRRDRLPVLGAVVAPVCFLLVLGGLLESRQGKELPAVLQSLWLPVHVSLAILGHAVLALACATSLLYLVEDNRLKAKRPGSVRRLFPPLEKLDSLTHRLLAWGFPLLTLGIVSGALWAHVAWGHFWSWEPRQSFSLLTWVLYGVLLERRLAGGWQGRRAATLTILGFAVLVVSFVSVNYLLPGRHGGDYGS